MRFGAVNAWVVETAEMLANSKAAGLAHGHLGTKINHYRTFTENEIKTRLS